MHGIKPEVFGGRIVLQFLRRALFTLIVCSLAFSGRVAFALTHVATMPPPGCA